MKPITINLLGAETKAVALALPSATQLDMPLVTIVAIGLIAVLGLPPLALWVVDTFLVNPATAQSDDLTRQIGQNKGAVKQLNLLQADVTKRQHDLDELEGLVGRGGGWASTLEELRNLTPTDLWLTSFRADSGGVSLSGDALAYKDVAYFYTNLQNARNFSAPILSNVAITTLAGQQVVQFSLHAAIPNQEGTQ